MKKLFQVVLAIAMVVSFLPMAEAGDTAQLGLTVTFDQPLKIWSEPEGPFEVTEGKELIFGVIAEDQDSDLVTLEAVLLPDGATFEQDTSSKDMEIPNRPIGVFKWTPDFGQAKDDPYLAVFKAKNDKGDEIAELEVAITVLPAVISIELEPTTWALEGVKLGEKRDNIADFGGEPIHHVKNTGNVAVGVDIGYGYLIAEGIQPGIRQGLDTFITGLGRVDNHVLLEPNGRLMVGGANPGDEIPLWLTYGAPTSVSGDIGHGATYELRVYKEPDPIILY